MVSTYNNNKLNEIARLLSKEVCMILYCCSKCYLKAFERLVEVVKISEQPTTNNFNKNVLNEFAETPQKGLKQREASTKSQIFFKTHATNAEDA